MTTDEIRVRFLDFFKARGHKIVRSDSLVPENDPTLLFTSAGMNQFKDHFLGLKRDLKRAASSQKCLRTGDLDQVGRSTYHHSFFEMLGNFSFGDYFKKEAISWAWEFLTQELGLPRERLRVSVHESDEEAYKIWRDEMRVPEKGISRLGDETNFWPAEAPAKGPNGPCGPCSEIYYDQGEDYSGKPHRCSIEHDCGRFTEIWNLVFTQYDRQEGGKLVPLKNKNIDTGMGLERLACVMQGKKTNFEIDIFQPINQAIERTLETKIDETEKKRSLYAISDHVRAVAFAMADGVIPSNEGRGYVVRKLIRRAVWHGYEISVSKPFAVNIGILSSLIPVVVSVMGNAYPELRDAEESIVTTLHTEEKNFQETLGVGRELLEQMMEKLKQKGQNRIPGEAIFELYDTHGLPEFTASAIASKKGFEIDREGYNRLMEEQRKRAKKASQMTESIFVVSDLEKKFSSLPATQFLGYQSLSATGKVLFAEVQSQKGIVLLDRTPFYAESGGQVGDQGVLENNHFKARVLDTQKKDRYFVHSIEIEKGSVKIGDEVRASVDQNRRGRAMRNHTATHLLHAALRNVLGNQVRQLGSLVAPEKLRFDYSYAKPLSPEQLKQIEDLVNTEILKDTAVTKEEKPTEEAKKEGAIAFFGEKYGDRVRIVSVPGFSKEFCGGTHCDRTGQIGAFVITSDDSIASGVRRIEAITGEGAIRYMQDLRSQLRMAADKLKTTPTELTARIEKLQEKIKKFEKSSTHKLSFDPMQVVNATPQAGPFPVYAERIDGVEVNQLREIYFNKIRSQPINGIWCLGSDVQGKAYFVVGASGDFVNDPSLNIPLITSYLASEVGGNGGGNKSFFAQAGTSNISAFKNKWSSFPQLVNNYLKDIQKQ